MLFVRIHEAVLSKNSILLKLLVGQLCVRITFGGGGNGISLCVNGAATRNAISSTSDLPSYAKD
jgi:hypothetical protein